MIRGGGSDNPLPRDCATSGYKRVIHDANTWRFLQQVYIDTKSEFSLKYANRRKNHASYSGFNVAVEVKDFGKRGRSIYAAEPIAEGTKIWDDPHLVKFYTPRELRDFLGQLDHDLQCDALLWAYVQKGEGHVALALDPGSFVNHGETEDSINLDKDCYALRDISVGEELLENYTEFIGFGEQVEWFNRIRGVAWNEDEAPSERAYSTDEYNLLGAPKAWGSGEYSYGYDLTDGSTVGFLPVFVVVCAIAFALRKTLLMLTSGKEKGGI